MSPSSNDRQIPSKINKGLPEDFWLFEDAVNEDWNSGCFDLSNEKSLNGYTIYITISYQKSEMYDEAIYQAFIEDFNGWDEVLFDKVRKELLRALRTTLRQRGCFVASDRSKLSRNLNNTLQAEWHEWTVSEINQQQDKQGGFLPRSCYSIDRRIKEETKASISLTTSALKPPTTTTIQHHIEQIPRQITDLIKIYNDNGKKYSGERYDFLNKKLEMFYDFCEKIGLQPVNHTKALSVMLTGKALQYYYQNIVGKELTMEEIVNAIEQHFETSEVRRFYLNEWRTVNLQSIIHSNPGKAKLECFEILLDKFNQIQPGLSASYRNDTVLRDQILVACQGIPECSYSLYKPSETVEGVCADMRNAISTKINEIKYQSFRSCTDEQFWTDRTYSNNKTKLVKGHGSIRNQSNQSRQNQRIQKKCYICGKVGCWSTKHGIEERRVAYQRYKQSSYITDIADPSPNNYQSFLTEFEGTELDGDNENDDEIQQLMAATNLDDIYEPESYLTELGEINGVCAVTQLNNYATFHAVTGIDVSGPNYDTSSSDHFIFEDRYSSSVFQGIMPDTGAAGISTAGLEQVKALQRQMNISIDETTAGQHQIRFGKGEASSIGSINIPTPLGHICFEVVPTNTPFLLCLKDMDTLNVQFDNLQNLLIQNNKKHPVVRKWGHPWLLLDIQTSITSSHLTETELRQLHRRFGHPSIRKFSDLLTRAEQNFERGTLERIAKYCHQCQLHGKSPGRFKFNIKEDLEFNAEVVVDIMYINGKPILHVVDTATSFQAAKFLRRMDAKTVWETLRLCWIDTYNGPPDVIVTDAGKNFTAVDFKQSAQTMSITVKEIPVEAHHSIGKVERYHAPLKRAYQVIESDLPTAAPEQILSMAVKAINDTAGPNGLVPTLLVFGAYPRISGNSLPAPSITARSEAVRAAMKEIRILHAKRKVADALKMRNGPDVTKTLQLSPNDDVVVWREHKGWEGPFKLLSIDDNTCIIDLPHGPTNFRSTVVKPYHKDETTQSPSPDDELHENTDIDENDDENSWCPPSIENEASGTSRRGRPKGSKNKPKLMSRPNSLPIVSQSSTPTETMMSAKEEQDRQLSIRLRGEGKITSPGDPFEASDKEEICALMANNVFRLEQFDPIKHGKMRIFNSRLVREVKGKGTDKPYEKSRLVIQGYDDDGKKVILTQAPTIQRCSQRIILALAPSLLKSCSIYLRDITQAYVQSVTTLNRTILAHLPSQIKHLYPNGTIMIVLKPLYGIAEAGTHWWATYNTHHREKLHMISSSYDPCLLISTKETGSFGIVGMQTDDTIILGESSFSDLENQEMTFKAKEKQSLTEDNSVSFNGCILELNGSKINLLQKEQSRNISLVDIKSVESGKKYVEQRARGAYIASICQPEATFDLSRAAQTTQPTQEDINALNKRLRWQQHNLKRGITYIPINLKDAKIFVFVDSSFANNRDLSSQIGFIIILGNEYPSQDNKFKILGNLIHWSSTKSKRVTRSVLAAELYGMASGVDMGFVIAGTISMAMEQLGLPKIPLIICTDSFSLYECIVKLGTTKEKRLMVDIMALRQMYERRELWEVRWINSNCNPADSMTKITPNNSLEGFLNTNLLEINVEGWVKR